MATNAGFIVREKEAQTELARAEVARAELERILESEFFRNSQRCSRLLRYSVEHVLDGCKAEDLKERVIGFELFHRGTSYDPARDNVVRMAASDLRKRLAQYYNRSGTDRNPVFEFPSGSYAVVCHWRENGARPRLLSVEEAETVPDPGTDAAEALAFQADVAEIPSNPQVQKTATQPQMFSRKIFLKIFLGMAALLSLVAAGMVFRAHRSSAAGMNRVWSPIVQSGKPVLICIAEPHAWLPAYGTSPDPNLSYIQVQNIFVGVGDAYALAEIGKLLSKRGVDWHLLAANENPPQDLLTGPTILIGAFSNQWRSQGDGGARFLFDTTSGGLAIVDRSDPNQSWKLPDHPSDWKTTDDYALITGFRSAKTGEPTIALAGITNYGTQAAADFVTNPILLKREFRLAPRDWHGTNFQFVLHVKLVGNTPTVVAAYFW